MLLITFLCLLSTIPLIWPGDAPWINDEPKLIQLALNSKTTGQIATHGLIGSRGIVYGPFPVWIYTALLHISDDLIALVRLRAGLVTLLTAVSIAWLARVCVRLRPMIGALALLSPYLWLYSRQLWDNTFLIPLTAFSAAAYLSFCARPAVWKFWLAGLAMVCMFLTHLMSLPWILPILAHGAWVHRDWIREHGRAALGMSAAAVLMSWPYLSTLADFPRESFQAADYSAWRGWGFPFLGGQIFSTYGLDYFFGEDFETRHVLPDVAGWILMAGRFTWIAVPLVWIGMGIVIWRMRQTIRSAGPRDAEFHFGLISCAAVLCQCVLNGMTRTYGHPHYFNATWICFFYFLWAALSSLPVGLPVRIGHAACLAAGLAVLILNVHRSGGNQSYRYGPALGHQIDIARKINAYHPDSPVFAEFRNYQSFPHAYRTIRTLYRLRGTDTGALGTLTIRPAADGTHLGWLTVQEAG